MPKLTTRHGVLLLAFVVVVVALGVRSARHEVAGDFARYYTAGGVIADGEHERLYEKMDVIGRFEHHFRYLPTFAILMAPLSLLPIRAAFCVWQLLHVLMYVLGLTVSYRLVREKRVSAWWMLIPVLFTLRLFISNLQLGQVNPIMIGLTMLGIHQWSRQREGFAGALIGLGAAIKFTPILFLAVFAAKRRWRAFSGVAASVVFFVLVLPSIVMGPSLNFELLGQYHSLEGDLLAIEEDNRVDGQSLKALIYRYLTPMNAVHQHKHNDPIYVNFVDIGDVGAYAIYVAACVALVAALLFFCRSSSIDRTSIAIHASMAVITMILISPESRRAHFAILALPFTALTYFAVVPFLKQRTMAVPAILAAIAMAAIAVPSRGIVGRPVANQVDAYGNMGWAAIALFVALVLTQRALSKKV